MTNNAAMIADLNDRLRKGDVTSGKVVITSGVSKLDDLRITLLVNEIANFNDFNEGNDPHGERDLGFIDFEGDRYMWKIDYYDRSYEKHSPDPTDPRLTKRVLTIMLASEY